MPPEQNKDTPQMVTMTQEQFDAILEQQENERQSNNDRWAQLLNGGQQQQHVEAPPKFEVNLDGLPDPTQDLEGYHKGLGGRLSSTYLQMLEQARKEALNTVTSAKNTEDLMSAAWTKLGENHPELAEFPDLVESAATKVYNELASKGINPQQAFSQDMEGIVERIADRAKQTYERIRGIEADDDDAGKIVEEDDFGRTFMLEGRSPARSKPAAKKQAAAEDDFVGSLKKLQAENFIY